MNLNGNGIVVAPYAGAWIEIAMQSVLIMTMKVAPYAGAWIEIRRYRIVKTFSKCRSLRGSVD